VDIPPPLFISLENWDFGTSPPSDYVSTDTQDTKNSAGNIRPPLQPTESPNCFFQNCRDELFCPGHTLHHPKNTESNPLLRHTTCQRISELIAQHQQQLYLDVDILGLVKEIGQ
jgi:hypothetical protein